MLKSNSSTPPRNQPGRSSLLRTALPRGFLNVTQGQVVPYWESNRCIGPGSLIRRVFQSLHFKIASGVIGTVLLLSTIYFVWDYRHYKAQLLQEAKSASGGVAQVTLNSLLQLSMLGNHPELLQRATETLARESAVDRISILDLTGQVRFSSDKKLLGRRFSLEEPGCRGCHSSGRVSPRSAFLELSGEPILRHAGLIPNSQECRPCHSSGEDRLGVLLVDFSTAEFDQKANTVFREKLWKAGLALFAILLVLGVLLNRVVIIRIRRLTELVSGIGSNQDASRFEALEGPDEIGRLAQSFREMTGSLKKHCDALEEKEKIRVSLLERLVQSQEEERRAISLELHDELGQSLSALLLSFQTDLGSGDSRAPGAVKEISEAEADEIEARVRKLIDTVHSLAWRMRPSILDDYGLDSALRRYIEETARTTNLQLGYKQIPPEGFGRLPSWLEVTLYRIAQEGITNVIRHAEATQASLILIRNDSEIRLLLEDNGRGFNPTEIVPSSEHGLGLLGMQERTNLCGGSFKVESGQNKGTTVRVSIPLDRKD